MPVDPIDLGVFLRIKLMAEDLSEVSAIEAAGWLNEAGLLRKSDSRPDKPLRDLLRDGRIAGA